MTYAAFLAMRVTVIVDVKDLLLISLSAISDYDALWVTSHQLMGDKHYCTRRAIYVYNMVNFAISTNFLLSFVMDLKFIIYL